jgi:nucleotide-binding universal stress UspA family protein
MYKDLLVHLDASEQGERRLDAAIALAKNLDTRLSGLYVVPPPPAALYAAGAGTGAGGVADATLYAALLEPLEKRHHEARERLSKRVGASDVEIRWLEAAGPVQAVIGDYARCSDLVIIGQEPEQVEIGHLDPMPSPGGIVLETGRPVLVVPRNGNCDLPGGHAMVAWNASAEAARALHDALPLLSRCESVTVQTFVDQEPEDEAAKPGFDVADHLKRHGINARVDREHADGDPGEALLGRARELSCTMIVMGAYGHSRLREYMFGGVTRHVFANATIPLLVAH